MKCHICDATLGETEIKWNKDHKDFDPCHTCKTVIDEVFGEEDDYDNPYPVYELEDDTVVEEPLENSA